MDYIETLIRNCNLALTAQPTTEFVLSELCELQNLTHAIYIIEQTQGNPNDTFTKFSKFKSLKTHSCARLNSPSSTLYVGSSTTNIKKRITEHLGNGHPSTYALHLKHWFDEEYKITIKLYDQPIEVLQIIEDAISYKLRPAFGKLGGNGKL